MYANLDAGVSVSEFGQSRQQRVDRALIDSQRQLPALQPLQFGESLGDLIAQIQQNIKRD